MRTNRAKKGITLVELAVSMTLLLLVMSLTSLAMKSGTEEYLSLRSSIDLQQNALSLLTRVSREGTETNMSTVWPPPVAGSPLTVPAGDPKGVVFASPRDNDGNLVLEPASLQPEWQKRIAYWHDPGADKLYRATEDLASPGLAPPAPDPVFNTAWFRDNGTNDPFSAVVEQFEVEADSAGRTLKFQIEFSEEHKGVTRKLRYLTSATPRV